MTPPINLLTPSIEDIATLDAYTPAEQARGLDAILADLAEPTSHDPHKCTPSSTPWLTTGDGADLDAQGDLYEFTNREPRHDAA